MPDLNTTLEHLLLRDHAPLPHPFFTFLQLVNGLQNSSLAMQRHYSVQLSIFSDSYSWPPCMPWYARPQQLVTSQVKRITVDAGTHNRIYSFPNHILTRRHVEDPVCRPPSKSASADKLIVCEGRDLCLSVPTEQ